MKKVISFVLVLALVLGSFSMAFAAPVAAGLSDIEGNANEEAIQVVNDLEIVTGYPNGTYQPTNAVTRAEFAAMITRALAIPESALAGYTTSTFKDTAGFGWAVKYLAFCQDKGIMLGDGNGNAMPGQTITVNEAVTMILRALGYTNNSSVLVGNWPTNYVTLAQTLGLYDNVAAATTVDRAAAAQLIYNALTVVLVQVATDGTTTSLGASLLTAGLDCWMAEDVIIEYGVASIISLVGYVGALADVYYNSDDEIVAVKPTSTFVTGEFNADGEFEADNDVTYKLGVGCSTTAVAITNAEANGSVTIAGLNDNGNTYTIAADVSGKTLKDIYTVATWTVTAAAQADDDVQEVLADDQELLGIAFDTDDNDEIDGTTFALYGAANLEAIAEDDVVYVYALANDENDVIVKVEVGTETVTGKVTKVNVDDAEYTIAGKVYSIADNGFEEVSSFEVGDEGEFILDYDGNIFTWNETDSKADNYAVVTYAQYELGKDTMISLLDKEGNEKDYVLKDDAVASSAALSPGAIVTFSLDKNGKIKDIEKAIAEPISGKLADDASVLGKTIIKSSVVVFIEDDGDYSVDKVTNLTTDEIITVTAVKNDDGKIVVILANESYLGNSDDTYGIVTKCDAKGENADEDTVQLLDVIVDGKVMKDVLTDDLSVASTTASNGALMKISIDADGIITKVEEHDIDAEDVVDETSTTVASIDGKAIVLANENSYRIADDAVLYVWDADDEEWTVKKSLSSLKKLHVTLYDTDDDTTGFDVVMAY